MDVNNNAWYFTGEIDYKKIPLIQKCKNIIVKCSVTTNFEVDNIISYLHNICSSGEMKTLDLREFYLPSGIYSIGYCSNIEKIILPQGESRISYCKNLKEIVLPQNSLLNITETNHNISLTKFRTVSIVSLCSIYQTIALIRDFNIDLQWGRYYVSLLLFFS